MAPKTLRVLFVTRAYSQAAGGMERLSYELTAECAQAGVATQVVAYQGPRWRSPFFALTALPTILRLSRQADLIHLGDPLLSVTAWFMKRLTSLPIAMTVHGLDLLYPHLLYQWYLRLFLPAVDHFLPISQYVKTLLDVRGLGTKATVALPGIRDQYYRTDISRQALADVLGRSIQNSLVLVTTGRLVKRKGQAWFVANVLPQLPPQVLYVIAGNGPDENAIGEAAQHSGVTNRVLMLGRVSREVLHTLYNTADAFIQPNIRVSGDAEGFGLVLLEAASCGLPIFAADLEGVPDAVDADHNATLLPSGNTSAWQKSLSTLVSPTPAMRQAIRDYTIARATWKHRILPFLQLFSAWTTSTRALQ